MPTRSLPVFGSVIAIAPIRSPVTMPGSQRCFCSSVPSSVKYGSTMSLCRVIPLPLPITPVAPISSAITAAKR